MSDPHNERHTSVTIKVPESKRYVADNPWLVFHGSPKAVREQIQEAFGFDSDDSLSLFEVTLNAQRLASNMGNAAQQLGGTVMSKAEGKSDEPAEVVPEPQTIEAAIDAAETKDELRGIWGDNATRFANDPELKARWQAKGKSLPA